jgi:hypothetical protein
VRRPTTLGCDALTLRTEVIAMRAQGSRNHGLFRWSPRSASRTVLAVLVLCPPALAGCGSPEEPRVQRVAFCQGPSTDDPHGDLVTVEFRQGATVVARGTVPVGTALTAEVPVGAIQIYVDGVRMGAVNEGVATDGPYHSPAPDEVIYIASAEGCPDAASL